MSDHKSDGFPARVLTFCLMLLVFVVHYFLEFLDALPRWSRRAAGIKEQR